MTETIFEIKCYRCGRTPDQIGEYVDAAKVEGISPEEYAKEDGTYNSKNGHFCCDSCYISIGMPASGAGWKAP